MKTNQFISCMSVALLVLALLTGCDDVSQEPRFRDKEVTLSAEGGSRTCEIILRKTPWVFDFLYVYETSPSSRVYVPIKERKKIDKTDLTYRMTERGELTFTYEWITIVFARDKKSITVIAEPNHTGMCRHADLYIQGGMLKPNLHIYQEP